MIWPVTQELAGTSIVTPHFSSGFPPVAPNPRGSVGDHVQPAGGVIWAENIRPTEADPHSDPLGARFVVGLPV